MKMIFKRFKPVISFMLIMALSLGICGQYSNAKSYDKAFEYNRDKDKVYTRDKLTKGLTQVEEGLSGKAACNYQIYKIKGNKIWVRPQAGEFGSADPYFAKKTYKYKLSKTCKFYYTNVSFLDGNTLGYKKISKAAFKYIVKYYKKYISYEKIYDVATEKKTKKKYYVSGYFGELFMKNGEIEKILTNDGD